MGGLFNSAKTMVSVLHKELVYKVEKLKCKKLEVMQSKIKNKSKLPVGEQTTPIGPNEVYTVMID